MAKNFHESFSGAEVKLPSDRSVGFTFAAVALVLAWLWRKDETVLYAALGAAAALALLGLAFPILLRPLNILWFRFGMLLHRIVNPLVMLAVFVLVFLPAGLIMRIRHDPLKLHRSRSATTYWIERSEEKTTTASMTNQF